MFSLRSLLPGSKASSAALGAAAGVALWEFVRQWLRHRRSKNLNSGDAIAPATLPPWLQWIAQEPATYRVLMREWEDLNWRKQQGWEGSDLIHGGSLSAVSIPCYYFQPKEKILRGPVYFGKGSESHHGFCHGGAMTSAMDDMLGHICFIAVGQGPWSGATVQINVSLAKPVRIGQTLLIEGKVVKTEQRKSVTKVSIEASLIDEHGEKYASMEGLAIAGAKIQPVETEIEKRTWSFDETQRIMYDSGWNAPPKVGKSSFTLSCKDQSNTRVSEVMKGA